MRPSLVVLVTLICLSNSYAQQTVFNVPSGDVLDSRTGYIENDWYVRPWETTNEKYGTTYIRGVMGLGHNVEAGFNVGAFDLVHTNTPFADFAVKWEPWIMNFGNTAKPGALGIYLGNHVGIGIGGSEAGSGRDFVYGSFLLKVPGIETRICAGPYFATKKVFDSESRIGSLVTFEQPLFLLNGLVLAADWFSGSSAYLTSGLIYSNSPFIFYLGYGFANSGRRDDQITAEVGLSFGGNANSN